jgi:glycosyltransferase involved in cell wall biosynthesis
LIATSVGGIPEITAGTDTVLIASGNAAQIANAIRQALAQPAKAAAQAAELRANVQQKFSVGRMADAALSFYSLSD